MSTKTIQRFTGPLTLLFLLLAAAGCRAPAELDPVASLPVIAPIERSSQRPTVAVEVDESLDPSVLPDGLMAKGTSTRDPRPIDRLRRTLMEGMRATRHFNVVEPDEDPEYLLRFTVSNLHEETPDDVGMFEWFSYKFFGRYLMASATIGATLYDGETDEPIGLNMERVGEYQILQGKAFRKFVDQQLDLLTMGSGFSKGGDTPALPNAIQKALVKLINDVAIATDRPRETVRERHKDVDA